MLNDVVDGDDADEVAVGAHDGRAAHAIAAHLAQRELEARILTHGEQVPRHRIAYPHRFGGNALRDDSDDDVAIGQDADRHAGVAARLDDDQVANMLFAHERGCVHDALGFADRRHVVIAD